MSYLKRSLIAILLGLLSSGAGIAQSNVGGQATLSLQEGPTTCGDVCITVDIQVDITGLMGTGGDAGLNAFVLAFDLDRSDVFASALRGNDLSQSWTFVNTDRDQVTAMGRVVLVGVAADTSAPNSNYLVSTMTLCGTPGDVTLTFVPSESSLGSRVVGGEGPGTIDIAAPAPFTFTILEAFSLDFGTGITNWLGTAPDYDLVTPNGPIDVQDLVKLVNCGLPD